MSGKGSAPRPFDVPREQYESNFDRIFRSKQETTPEEDEAWQQMEQSPSGVHADVHEPVMATDLGVLFLTAVDDVTQADMLAELEQENRLLRARNERLEHRLRELGEELP